MLRALLVACLALGLTACETTPESETLPALEFAQALAKAQRYDEAIDRYIPVLAEHDLPLQVQLEYWQLRRTQHEIDTIGRWAMPKPLARIPLTKWKHPPNFDELSFALQKISLSAPTESVRDIAFTELLRAANNEEDYRWLTSGNDQLNRCLAIAECQIQWGRYESIMSKHIVDAYQAALLNTTDWRYQLYSAVSNYDGDMGAFLLEFNQAIDFASKGRVDPWVIRQLSAYRRYLSDNYLIASR